MWMSRGKSRGSQRTCCRCSAVGGRFWMPTRRVLKEPHPSRPSQRWPMMWNPSSLSAPQSLQCTAATQFMYSTGIAVSRRSASIACHTCKHVVVGVNPQAASNAGQQAPLHTGVRCRHTERYQKLSKGADNRRHDGLRRQADDAPAACWRSSSCTPGSWSDCSAASPGSSAHAACARI